MLFTSNMKSVITVFAVLFALAGAVIVGYVVRTNFDAEHVSSSSDFEEKQHVRHPLIVDSNLGTKTDLVQVIKELSAVVGQLAENQASLEEQVDSLAGARGSNQTEPGQNVLNAQERQALFEKARVEKRSEYEQLLTAGSDVTQAWSAQKERYFESLFVDDPVVNTATNGNIACSNGVCRLEYEVPAGMALLEKDMLDMTLATKFGGGVASSTRYQEKLNTGNTKFTFYIEQASQIAQGSVAAPDDE